MCIVNKMEENPHGLVANVLGTLIVVSEFNSIESDVNMRIGESPYGVVSTIS